MAAQKQDDQLERTFSSYVRIQDVVLKTYLGRWTIRRSGERGSGISVLPARFDDDDIYTYAYKVTYIHMYTYICTYIHIHTYIHTCIYIHTHIYIYICTHIWIYIYMNIYMNKHSYIYIYIYSHEHNTHTHNIHTYIYIYRRSLKSFQTFFVWALLLIVHTWNSSPLRNNIPRLQCTCTLTTTSGSPHRRPLVWACQWPSVTASFISSIIT